jgi:hypothetical protein
MNSEGGDDELNTHQYKNSVYLEAIPGRLGSTSIAAMHNSELYGISY